MLGKHQSHQLLSSRLSKLFLFLQPATKTICILKTKWLKFSMSDEVGGTRKAKEFSYLTCQSKDQRKLGMGAIAQPGMEVRYLAFLWLPMILNTTDKLRSRHSAVLKHQPVPRRSRESHHLQVRSCPHLEECLLTWGWITYNNV